MIKKYLILVEGIADMIFFRDYLIFLDSNLEVQTEKIKKELILKSQDKNITLRMIGGYTEISNNKTIIQNYNKENTIKQGSTMVLVIQDTDNLDKDNGGILNRMSYLNNLKETLSLEFETFLFPNHKDDGDLETLLLQIVKDEKFNSANSCYSGFVKCLKNISTDVANELAKDKNKIFNYFRAYYGISSAKEVNRVYEQEYWNFDSDSLTTLKDFFDKKVFIGTVKGDII